MRHDVHVAALRAAAKVAFSIAFLNGCASGVESGSADKTDDTSSDETASKAAALSATDACPTDPQKSCTEVLASAFPGPDRYQTNPVAEPADVVSCCDKALEHSLGGAHRWACCVAYDPAVDPNGDKPLSDKHVMACSPWGPPVPPAMDRDQLAARRAARRARRQAVQSSPMLAVA